VVADEPFLSGDPELFALADLQTMQGWSYRS